MGKLSEAILGDQPYFDGSDYNENRDRRRLSAVLRQVLAIMQDGQWHNITELAQATGASEAGISARIRDLRKSRYGSNNIEKKHIIDGFWEYRLSTDQRPKNWWNRD